jgi:hypothetical protein
MDSSGSIAWAGCIFGGMVVRRCTSLDVPAPGGPRATRLNSLQLDFSVSEQWQVVDRHIKMYSLRDEASDGGKWSGLRSRVGSLHALGPERPCKNVKYTSPPSDRRSRAHMAKASFTRVGNSAASRGLAQCCATVCCPPPNAPCSAAGAEPPPARPRCKPPLSPRSLQSVVRGCPGTVGSHGSQLGPGTGGPL